MGGISFYVTQNVDVSEEIGVTVVLNGRYVYSAGQTTRFQLPVLPLSRGLN